MQLGDKILQLRTQKNLSQGALADELGVSRQSISKWETNSSVPELDKLVKLAEVFGVSLDELVLDKAQPEKPQPEERIVYVGSAQGAQKRPWVWCCCALRHCC